MIPLYKLEKLPRTQKLRKIAKVFTFAENRLSANKTKGALIFTETEFVFFYDAAKLLATDSLFSADARKVFTEAAGVFETGTKSGGDILSDTLLRRTLNSIKHILLSETGRDQADWDFTGSDGQLDPNKRQVIEGMRIYMEDIRSPFNIGAMFRTAESFGIEKIILSPFCADPHHRRAERTAMGCIDIIPWERQDLFSAQEDKAGELPLPDLSGKLPAPKTANPVFALETGGIPLAEFSFPRRGILIVGSEELGVSPQALAAADASLGRVSISCYGTKASLNVSVAFGIAIQAWRQSISSISINDQNE